LPVDSGKKREEKKRILFAIPPSGPAEGGTPAGAARGADVEFAVCSSALAS